jgi:tetratricopeptide (TPR) repeat protein/branched-subunit amino acid transport protein AzlD
VSTLAGRWTAPRRASRLDAILDRLVTRDTGVAAAVTLTLCLLAFVAKGGVELGPNTYMEVVLVAGGGLLGAGALAVPHRRAPLGPLHGGRTLGLFGVLVALTALSIAWSFDADTSWLEANRTLAYLAAFGGAMAFARLAPSRWSALLVGIAVACTVIGVYALATRVFPEWLAADERASRLRAPFGYWNAVGLMAALGVPPLLWLASRRSGHAAANALAYPALGALLVCLMFSYSRGALLALAVGLAAWFAIVPLRLRSAAALAGPVLTTALVLLWAFNQDALAKDDLVAAARADAGAAFGVLLILQAVVLLGVGLAIGFAGAFTAPRERTRRLVGQVLVGLVALALIAAVAGVAGGKGGLGGAWHRLTDPDARTPANSPNRLTATASVRARYWDEAFKVHATQPWLGVGAGGYGTARRRFRTQPLEVRHAHGYIVQTLADLGWAGLLASLAAALAWLFTAARVLGLRRADRGLSWDAERVGVAALATVVIVFAAHSAIDWTWFIPANAVAGLICAGWVCARPPLRARLHDEGPTGIVPAAERAGVLPATRRFTVTERLAAWRPSTYRSVLALGVLGIGMATCWSIVQPLRAEHAGDAAVNRLDAAQYAAAADIAQLAQQRNPLSVEPWYLLAAARSAQGDRKGTVLALVEAVKTQPANAEAWRRLGEFELDALGDPKGALAAFQAAYYLDPQSRGAQSDVIEASRAVEAAP